MASWQSKALKRTLAVSRLARSNEIGRLRKWFALSARGRIPRDVTHHPVVARGVNCEWVRVQDRASSDVEAMLYIHGGGFAVGSCATHREFVGRLAREVRCPALSVDYRLAPEHPYPAALDDVIEAWRWLLDEGVDATRAVIAGDSAGGALTLSGMLRMRDEGLPLPAAAVCFSPCVDLTAEAETLRRNAADDPMLDNQLIEQFSQWYAGHGHREDPYASPILAELTGLPPMLVMAGTFELMEADARRWADRARKYQVDVTLDIWEEMVHIWPYFAWFLPEGKSAIRRVGDYLRAILAPHGSAEHDLLRQPN